MSDRRQVHLRVWLDGEPLEDPMAHILAIEVDERTDAASTLQMVLPMAPIDGDWDLLERGEFLEGYGLPDLRLLRRVSVEFGVQAPDSEEVDDAAVVFDGYLTVIEPIFGEVRQAESVLKVMALDASCLMHFDARLREWKGLTDAQIVERIYEEYGFSHRVASTNTQREEARGTVVQRGTDAELVRMLARRNGYESYVEFEGTEPEAGPHPKAHAVGHFRPPDTASDVQPTLTLFPDDAPTLIDFRARWESHHATHTQGWHIDTFTRRLHRVDEADSGVPPMGEQTRAKVLRTQLDRILSERPELEAGGLQKAYVPHDSVELGTLAQAQQRASDWFVRGVGVVQGERYPAVVRPRRPIELSGAGTLLDGRWYVLSVRHRWGVDPEGLDDQPDPQGQLTVRYEADVELVRNALGGAA